MNKTTFKKWLIGFVDGDGCFSIVKNGTNRFNIVFSIGLSCADLPLLEFIKKNLGVGRITVLKSGMAIYRVRDRNLLLKKIIPIFNDYPLLTGKFKNYLVIKKALEKKNIDSKGLFELKKKLSRNHIGRKITLSNISLEWIIGFVEAEGSFYTVLEKTGRLRYYFGISQKNNDNKLLELIVKKLQIRGRIRFKKTYWLLESEDIETLIKKFRRKLKGYQNIRFIYWVKGYTYYKKGNLEKALFFREKQKKLRKQREENILKKLGKR